MSEPSKVRFAPNQIPDSNPISIQSGENHTTLLTQSGAIYVAGSNDKGQLGHDRSQSRFEPVSALKTYKIQSVAVGEAHTLARDEWGKVFAWGDDEKGQCGLNTGETFLPSPRMIRGLGTVNVVQVAAGAKHSLVLTDSGKLFAFGDNSFGQLGIPDAGERVLTPQPIQSLSTLPIQFIACGGHHTGIITLSGAVYMWGRNSHGQLGLGHQNNSLYPCEVKQLKHVRVRRLALGNEHSVALTDEGRIMSWGCGNYGQHGHGNKNNELLPRQIVEMMGTEVGQIACGKRHTLAYVPKRDKKGGKIYAFGLGGSGQLGRGNLHSASAPSVIPVFNEAGAYLIGAGGDHSFVCTSGNPQRIKVADHRKMASDGIQTLTPELLSGFSKVKAEEALDQDFLESVETVFQSAASLNGSLLTAKHEPCTGSNSGIDLKAWRTAFKSIEKCRNETLKDAVRTGILTFVLPKLDRPPPDKESMRIFLTLPLYHLFDDPSLCDSLQTKFNSLSHQFG